jgi:hypothetical protein
MNNYKGKLVEISQMYWLLHGIVIFSMKFYGTFLPIVSICIFINYALRWIIPNEKYKKAYSILMIVYSIIYLILNGIILLFFRQSPIMYLAMLSIIILNFIISVITYIEYKN